MKLLTASTLLADAPARPMPIGDSTEVWAAMTLTASATRIWFALAANLVTNMPGPPLQVVETKCTSALLRICPVR